MNKKVFILRVRILAIAFCFILLGYIALAYQMPFGAERLYSLREASISALLPASRTEKVAVGDEVVTKQKDDLIYFTTKYPFRFDRAKVKIRFQNSNPNQRLELGFKDKPIWHYDMQVVDMPFMHSEEWRQVGEGPVLFQKSSDYSSVEQFFNDYPAKSLVGTLAYSIPEEEMEIPNYVPEIRNTVIDTPLRGQHIMYVYVENEPFYMKVQKRDLNWYPDPDVLEIKVYKEGTTVFTAVVDDDGIEDDSKTPGILEEIEIQNPGPELPEPGVYKIIFDSSEDTLITHIETNLHKIVFAGHIYAAHNAEVYGPVGKTATTTLFTNSKTSAFTVPHDAALQDATVNGETLPLHERGVTEKAATNQDGETTKITLPKSDARVEGAGFYSLAEDQFFLPTRFSYTPIYGNEDAELVDYIISAYKPHRMVGGYYETEREFDLSIAAPEKGKLNWLIRAPGLKENGNEIIIKDIVVEYTKQSWW
jgi:hypothetical protein